MPQSRPPGRHAVGMSLLRSLTKQAAHVVDGVWRPASGITVLIYHRVGGHSASGVDLDPVVFDAQLSWLRQHTEVVSLDAALAVTDDRPRVVVTFDDGTADFVEFALPALVRHAVPAVSRRRVINCSAASAIDSSRSA